MNILEGLLFINDADVYKTHGAFLSEDKEGDHANYDALKKFPKAKPHVAVSFREEDGEKLPDELVVRFEARDVTLQFAIIAAGKADFEKKYRSFLMMLRSGWLEIRLPELNRTYRVYYLDCPGYDQLTPLDGETVATKFKVKFREPNPAI